MPSWPPSPEWWKARRSHLAAAAARSAVEALQAAPPTGNTVAALERAQRALAAATARVLPYPPEAVVDDELPDWLR